MSERERGPSRFSQMKKKAEARRKPADEKNLNADRLLSLLQTAAAAGFPPFARNSFSSTRIRII